MDYRKIFAERLKELRLEHNLTQVELAQKTNTSKSVISAWELEQNEPSVSSLISIAKFFDVSLDYLCGLDDYY